MVHENLLEALLLQNKSDILPCIEVIIATSKTLTSRYYRINVLQLLQDNRDSNGELKIVEIANAFGVLEKYGNNLLKHTRPPQWRTVRFSNFVFHSKVEPVKGCKDILKLLGYTEQVHDGFAFPPTIKDPNTHEVGMVTCDIILLKNEMTMLQQGVHPNPNLFQNLQTLGNELLKKQSLYKTVPKAKSASGLSSFQEGCATVSGHTSVSQIQHGDSTPASLTARTSQNLDDFCVVCGQKLAELFCATCLKKQCKDCDKIWHQYPNRVGHKRVQLATIIGEAVVPTQIASSSSSSSITSVKIPSKQNMLKKNPTSNTNVKQNVSWEDRIAQIADELLGTYNEVLKVQKFNAFCNEMDEQILSYKNGAARLDGGGSSLLSKHLIERSEFLMKQKSELQILFGISPSDIAVNHTSALPGDTAKSSLLPNSLDIKFQSNTPSIVKIPNDKWTAESSTFGDHSIRGPPSREYVPRFLPYTTFTDFNSSIGNPMLCKENDDQTFEFNPSAYLSNYDQETSQSIPTFCAYGGPMTLEEISLKMQQEDIRLKSAEMIDYLRQGEEKGFTPKQIEKALEDMKAQASSVSSPIEFLLQQNKSTTSETDIELADVSELSNASENSLDFSQHPDIIGFHDRLDAFDADQPLTIQDFLRIEDKQHMQHALTAVYASESEPVIVMLCDLLCHTNNSKACTVLSHCDLEDVIQAAQSFPDNFVGAVKYLNNQCMLCLENFPRSKVLCMPTCGDNECQYCQDCLDRYLQFKISEGHIRDIVCPVCRLPDIDGDEETTTLYFNYLDVVIRRTLIDETHELFQQKLRDHTLMKMPNFSWCSHCTNGFLFERGERTLKMVCPNCCQATCYKCKKPWEDQHEGISCQAFLEWKQLNDPDFQAAGLAAHLKENGIDCPNCKFRYALAKGGCMHFRCVMCSFQFCSGCKKPFKQGRACTLLQSCSKKGLHAHHPRNCLFYLRDLEVESLQTILNDAGLEYGTQSVSDHDYCQVLEQKETSTGLMDAECGRQVAANNAGLCNLHYKEYLVSLINSHDLDPATIFSDDELLVCLRRAEQVIPDRVEGMADQEYHTLLLEHVKQLPLISENSGQDEGGAEELQDS